MPRKILALDQSSHTTGYAIFEDENLIEYGHFTCGEPDMGDRLTSIRNQVLTLIKHYNINELIFEDIQLQEDVGNNVSTFKALSGVLGVLQQAAAELKIPYTIIPSTVWKSHLSIKGQRRPEQKKNAQKYVYTQYSVNPTEDEADAICIGASYIIDMLKNINWD